MVCADGIRLATRLWRPPSSGPSSGPWPVLLMRQPYGRAIASTVTYAHPRWYAERGFLVVVQDVRGCGDSEGEFIGFGQEAADGAAAVRWCRRLAGSNGRVGTYGFSYQGLSQLLIAPPPPAAGTPQRLDDPLPDCTAPAMCGVDERLHWATEGGAHWWSLGLAWGLQLAAARCRRRGDRSGWQRIRTSLEAGHYLEEGVELLERFDPGGMARGWLRLDPGHPEGWLCHPVPAALLRRPMLLIGGWHDPQLRGVLDLLQRAHAVGGRPRLRIGAWTHLDWRGGIDALQLRFFRRYLGGATTGSAAMGSATVAAAGKPDQPATVPSAGGIEPANMEPVNNQPALQCLRSGRWWRRAALAETAGRGWWLRSRGLAAVRSEEGELLPIEAPGTAAFGTVAGGGRVSLVHDPWRPVPSRGGHLGPQPGLVQRRDLDGRSDVACFTAPPLPQPLRLIGRPRLKLPLRADQPAYDLCVALAVVQGDGSSLQLCTGLRRILAAEIWQRAEQLVELQPLAVELQPGERLRCAIAAAAWPAIAVNPGDGSMPGAAAGSDQRIITLELDLLGAQLWLEPLIAAD
ncbi:MAG: CocE/NonD family hydrolase [Synechococcus sp.]|nr:CocE/NonD family hydrolase [Synechococcus sp.]